MVIKGHLGRHVELARLVPGLPEHAGLELVGDVDTVEAGVHQEDLVLADPEVTALGPANITTVIKNFSNDNYSVPT